MITQQIRGGWSSSIAIDSNDKIHITHFGSANLDLRYCNNVAGSWSCEKLADADLKILGYPGGRNLAIKRGRIVDSISFSDYVHISWHNATFLKYTSRSLPDISYPSFSNYNETPANNTAYVQGTTYQFNVTITSTNGSVGLDFNNTNYTASNLTADVYNVTFSDLAVGTYSYYWWAFGDGIDENFNISNTRSYTVAQCVEEWSCTDWSTCSGGIQTRTCIDVNNCGTTNNKPITSQTCSVGGRGRITEPQPTQTHSWTKITPEQPAEMSITERGLDLTKFTIATTETVTDASLTVTAVDVSQADLGIGLPTEKVYQAFNITTKKLNDTNIANVTIEFKINKTWLFEQNRSYENVFLHRKLDIENLPKWEVLPTNYSKEDSDFYYFSAISSRFSTFMIFIGTYECDVGEKRCFNDQIQLCLGNYTWMITEKCKFGCKDNECIEPLELLISRIMEIGSVTFYIVVGLISGTIVAVIYFIYKSIRKKRLKK